MNYLLNGLFSRGINKVIKTILVGLEIFDEFLALWLPYNNEMVVFVKSVKLHLILLSA